MSRSTACLVDLEVVKIIAPENGKVIHQHFGAMSDDLIRVSTTVLLQRVGGSKIKTWYAKAVYKIHKGSDIVNACPWKVGDVIPRVEFSRRVEPALFGLCVRNVWAPKDMAGLIAQKEILGQREFATLSFMVMAPP